MAKELTPNKLLFNGKYKIIKNLSFNNDGGVYTALDTETEEKFLIKEVIPPTSLSDEELEERTESFNQALLILTQFNHPNLTKIYLHFSEGRRQYVVMEIVEGITLKKLLAMSVKPLAEKQVLNWGKQICNAMQYLHDRPKPFIFDVLDSTHIMIDTTEKIKLINYGLDRFFVDKDAISFASSKEDLAGELRRLGDTLVFLLTRNAPEATGVTACDEISEPLARVLNRLLAQEPEVAFPNFDKLAGSFENVLNPPPPIEANNKPSKPMFSFIDFNDLRERCIVRFVKQPIWLIASEVIALFVLLFLLNMMINPPIKSRTTPAAYVACGNELSVINLEAQKVESRVKLPGTVNSLVSTRDGVKLFCSVANEGLLYLVNSTSNQLIRKVPVSNNPRRMAIDPTEKWLYALSSEEGHLSIVELNQEPLPKEPEANSKSKDENKSIYSLGREAKGLVVTSIGNLQLNESGKKASEDAQEEPPITGDDSRVPLAYCSSRVANEAMAFTYPPITEVAAAPLQAAGPLALTNDGKNLLVSRLDNSQIAIYKTPKLTLQGTIMQVGGSDIRQLLVSPDDKEVWIVNGSGTVCSVGIADKKLRGTVKLEGTPTSACWRITEGDPELWVATKTPNNIVVINASTRVVRNKIKISGEPSDICILPEPPKSE